MSKVFTVEVTFSIPGGGLEIGKVEISGPVEGYPILPAATLIQRILSVVEKAEGITEVKQVPL